MAQVEQHSARIKDMWSRLERPSQGDLKRLLGQLSKTAVKRALNKNPASKLSDTDYLREAKAWASREDVMAVFGGRPGIPLVPQIDNSGRRSVLVFSFPGDADNAAPLPITCNAANWEGKINRLRNANGALQTASTLTPEEVFHNERIKKNIKTKLGVDTEQQLRIALDVMGLGEPLVQVSGDKKPVFTYQQGQESKRFKDGWKAFLLEVAPRLLAGRRQANLDDNMNHNGKGPALSPPGNGHLHGEPAKDLNAFGGASDAYAATVASSVVANAFKSILRPALDSAETTLKPQPALWAETGMPLRDISSPQDQEVVVPFIGPHNMAKSTSLNAILYSSRPSPAEYLALAATVNDNTDEILLPDRDALLQVTGKDLETLAGEAPLKEKIRDVMGCSPNDLPGSWRRRMPHQDGAEAAELDEDEDEGDWLLEFLKNPESLGEEPSPFLLPVGTGDGACTSSLTYFKYFPKYALSHGFPSLEDMRQDAYAYVEALRELHELQGDWDSDTRREKLEELFGHLNYYNAFCGRPMKHSSSVYTEADLDDINELPNTPDDIQIGAFALEVCKQRVQQWYSSGTGIVADEAALQRMLAIQEGTGHESEADQQKDRQRAALMEVATVYGPFGACKGGHVFVDSPGVGDRNMQRRRRTKKLLGPVADGGTPVVVAMFPTDLEAADSLVRTLHENDVFEASFSGEKQLILVRMGEKDHDHKPKNYPLKGPMPLRAHDNIHHRKARSANVHLQVLAMLTQRLGTARRRQLQNLPFFDVLPVMFSALMKHPTWKPAIAQERRKKDMIDSEEKLATRDAMLRATEMPHLLGAIEEHLRRQTHSALVNISDLLEESRTSLGTIVDGTLQGEDMATLKINLPRLQNFTFQTGIVVANVAQIRGADELNQVLQAVDKVFNRLQDSHEYSGPCLEPVDDQEASGQEEVGRLIQDGGIKRAKASLRKAVWGSKNVYVDGVADYLHSRLWALEGADSGSGTDASKELLDFAIMRLHDVIDATKAACISRLSDMLEQALSEEDITKNQISRLAELLAQRYVNEFCLTKFGKANATLAKLRQSTPLLFSTGKASYRAAQLQLTSDRPNWLMTGLEGDRASQQSTVLQEAIPFLVRKAREHWRDDVCKRITAAWNKSMGQLADANADVEKGFSVWAAQNYSSDRCRMLLSEDITTAISAVRGAVNQLVECVGNAKERVGLEKPDAVDLDRILKLHGESGDVIVRATGDDSLLTLYLDTIQHIRRHWHDTSRPLLRELLRTACVAYTTNGILPPARQFAALPAVVHGANAIVRLAGDVATNDGALEVVRQLREVLQGVDLKAAEYGARQHDALLRLERECVETEHSFASRLVADVYPDDADLPDSWSAEAFWERCFELLPADLHIDAANNPVTKAVLSLHMWCLINQRSVLLVTGCDREYLLLQCLEPQTEDEAKGLLRALPVALRVVEGTDCVLFLTKPTAPAPQPELPDNVQTNPTGSEIDEDDEGEADNNAQQEAAPAVRSHNAKKRQQLPDEAGPSTRRRHNPVATPGEAPNQALGLDRGKAPAPEASPSPPSSPGGTRPPDARLLLRSTPPTSPVRTPPSSRPEYRAQTWALEDWAVACKQGKPPCWRNNRHPVIANGGVPTAVVASEYDNLRSQHATFCEAASGYLPHWEKPPNGLIQGRAGDDAHIGKSWYACVADGVGGGNQPNPHYHLWSTLKAESLVQEFGKQANKTDGWVPPQQNRAFWHLMHAVNQLGGKKIGPLGSTTVIAAELEGKVLHYVSVGDCQLAHFRPDATSGTLRCIFVSQTTQLNWRERRLPRPRDVTPAAIQLSNPAHFDPLLEHDKYQEVTKGECKAQEGDVFVLGSDGLFDNIPHDLDNSTAEGMPEEEKQRIALDNILKSKGFTTARQVANELFQRAVEFTSSWTPSMDYYPRVTPKPDDITVWAGRISYLRSPHQDSSNSEGETSEQVGDIPRRHFQPDPRCPERLILQTLTERRSDVHNDTKRSGCLEKGFKAGWHFSYV